MANLREIAKDPDFLALPDSEKIKALKELEPDLAGLPFNEQMKALKDLSGRRGPVSSDTPNADIAGMSPEQLDQLQFPRPGMIQTKELVPPMAGWKENLLSAGQQLPIAGAVVGGVTGAPAGLLGAPTGGVLGWAGGKMAERQLKELLLPKMKKMGLGEAAIKTVMEDIPEGMLMEVLGPLLSKIAPSALKETMAYGTKAERMPQIQVTPEHAEVVSFLKKEGIDVPPSAITQKPHHTWLEQRFEAMPGSGINIIKQKQNTYKQLSELRDTLRAEKGSQKAIDEIGRKMQSIGDELTAFAQTAKESTAEQAKTQGLKMGSELELPAFGAKLKEKLVPLSKEAASKKNALYGEPGRILGETKIETPNLNTVLDDIISPKDKPLGGVSLESPVVKFAKGLKDAETTTWAGLQKTRQYLADMEKQGNALIGTGASGATTAEGRVYGELKRALNKDLELAAKKHGPETEAAFGRAEKFYQEEYAPIWKQKGMHKTLTAPDEDVLRQIVHSGEVENITLMKKALGADFNTLIPPQVTRMLVKDATDQNGKFVGKKLLSNMSALGDDTLNAVYGSGGVPAKLKELANKETIMSGKAAEKIIQEGYGKGFSKDTFAAITGADPEKVFGNVIRTGSANRRDVVDKGNLRRLVQMEQKGGKGLTKDLREQWLNQSLFVPEGGTWSPFQAEQKFYSIGKDTIRFMYKDSPKELKEIETIMRSFSQAKNIEKYIANPSESGRAAMQNALFAYGLGGAVGIGSQFSTDERVKQVGKFAIAFVALPKVLSSLYLSDWNKRRLTNQILSHYKNQPKVGALQGSVENMLAKPAKRIPERIVAANLLKAIESEE